MCIATITLLYVSGREATVSSPQVHDCLGQITGHYLGTNTRYFLS